MATERAWVRDGLYRRQRLRGSVSERDIRATVEKLVEANNNKLKLRLQFYENWCERRLKESGYPFRWQDLAESKDEPLPRDVKDFYDLTLTISLVRQHVAAGDANLAATEMAELVERFMIIESRPLAPLVENELKRGKHLREISKKPKKRQGIWRAVEDLVATHPAEKALDYWAMLDKFDRENSLEVNGEFQIFREGSRLHQIEYESAKEQSLGFKSFQRYVGEAKKAKTSLSSEAAEISSVQR